MQNSFTPEEMTMLMRVVDDACARIDGCDDSMREMVALRVLSSASEGERDYDVLLATALPGRVPARA